PGQGEGRVEIVGNDDQVAPPPQRFADLGRRGAYGDEYRGTVRDQRRGATGDRLLGAGVLYLAGPVIDIGRCFQQLGAPVPAAQHVQIAQGVDVAPDCLRRHLEFDGKPFDGDESALANPFDDLVLAKIDLGHVVVPALT